MQEHPTTPTAQELPRSRKIAQAQKAGCKECGAPLGAHNKSGYCTKHVHISLNQAIKASQQFREHRTAALTKTLGEPTAYLPKIQWQNCYDDCAYEARMDIRDKVICRECLREALAGDRDRVELLNGESLANHLRRIHDNRTARAYRQRHPGAPLYSCECGAATSPNRNTVEKYMAERANLYATPEERLAATNDPDYQSSTPYLICRVERCGYKSRNLRKHITSQHMPIDEYNRAFPGARITSREFNKQQAKNVRKRWDALRAIEAKHKNLGNRKKEHEKWPNIVGPQVEALIPHFQKLFAKPEIEEKIVLVSVDIPDYGQSEINAAREALRSRGSRKDRPKIAARWAVALSMGRDVDWVNDHHKAYMRKNLRP